MKKKLPSKNEIIIYSCRVFFLISIISLFLSTFWIPYDVISKTSFNLILTFSISSVFYYSFIENKEDRILLVNIWKIYFPSIIVLYSVIFSVDNNVSNIRIDFYKTNLNYYLKR